MCLICGCGLDTGSTESLFEKNYKCQNCGQVFKMLGIIVACPNCQSRNVKRQK